jgi:hypothetical protein
MVCFGNFGAVFVRVHLRVCEVWWTMEQGYAFTQIEVTVAADVCTISLNRPHCRNAISRCVSSPGSGVSPTSVELNGVSGMCCWSTLSCCSAAKWSYRHVSSLANQSLVRCIYSDMISGALTTTNSAPPNGPYSAHLAL